MIKWMIDIIAGKGDGHRSLFLRNEMRSLVGKGARNLKTLFYFTLLAFFAVAFAHAGLKYLKMRMDNPFVNWITFPVSADIDYRYSKILNNLEDYSEDRKYTLDMVNGFMRYSVYFRDAQGKELDRVKGRTFTYPDDFILLEKVLSGDNLISSNVLESDPKTWSEEFQKQGVILTEDLVRAMGCEEPESAYGRYLTYYPEFKVIAIVRSLPDKALFMTSYEAYWGLVKSSEGSDDIFDYRPSSSLSFMTIIDEGKEFTETDFEDVQSKILTRTGIELSSFQLESLEEGCGFNALLTLSMADGPNDVYQYAELTEEVLKELGYLRAYLLEEYNWYRLGDLSASERVEYASGSSFNPYSSITLHFASIDSVRAFRKFLMNSQDIDLSLEQIESRENFYLVSILTSILAFSLIFFTLISIILFISNILKSHLEKIKMNLGTFMAFGLSNRFLISGYIRMITGILVAVSIFAIVIIGLIDVMDLPYRLLTALGMNLKPDFNEAFSVLSTWLFILIFLILVVTWWNCRNLVRKVLQHYPSDLIYNRTE
jgi:hypothetical protein